jgi:hypothetical protein
MAPLMNKRDFLRTSTAAGLGLLLGDRVWAKFADVPADQWQATNRSGRRFARSTG